MYIWLHLTRVIQKLHYSSVFASFWKEQVIQSFQPTAMSSFIFELWEHILQRISVRRKSLTAHTTTQKIAEKAPRGFFTKVRDHSDKKSFPLHLKHTFKEARQNPTRHTSQWWYHTTDPLFWGRGRNSRKRSDSSMTSQWIPPHFPDHVAHRKKRVSKCEAVMSEQNKDSKTSKTVVESHPPL